MRSRALVWATGDRPVELSEVHRRIFELCNSRVGRSPSSIRSELSEYDAEWLDDCIRTMVGCGILELREDTLGSRVRVRDPDYFARREVVKVVSRVVDGDTTISVRWKEDVLEWFARQHPRRWEGMRPWAEDDPEGARRVLERSIVGDELASQEREHAPDLERAEQLPLPLP